MLVLCNGVGIFYKNGYYFDKLGLYNMLKIEIFFENECIEICEILFKDDKLLRKIYE